MVLRDELQKYRSRSYSELITLVGQEINTEVRGQSGVTYQVEIRVFRDDGPEENLRVLGSIDDGGWRAFIPLTDSFILAPNGSFVGE